MPIAEVAVPAEAGRYPQVETGAWRDHVQLVWAPAARVLERRSYRIFDPFYAEGFDLFWQPRHPDRDRAGALNGEGILTWRQKGQPRYGTEGIVAQYIGHMSGGRLHGFGRFTDISGLRYQGMWAHGLMAGPGQLMTAGGDAYTGAFADGLPSGQGVLVDAAGLVHEGQFAAGLPDGPGLRAMPDGQTLAADWSAGSEVPGTRRPAPASWVQQNRYLVQTAGVEGLDISLGVGGAPRFCCQTGPSGFSYTALSEPGHLSIFPDDPALMDQWRGRRNVVIQEPVPFDWARAGAGEYSFLNYDSSFDTELPLRFGLRNATTQNVLITGVHLEIDRSRVDRQPMVQATVLYPLTPTNTAYSIENYGWGAAQNAVLTARFVNGEARSAPFTIAIGTIEGIGDFSFVPVLQQYGVALNRLGELATVCAGRHGQNMNPPGCTDGLLGTGIYGQATPYMRENAFGSAFGLQFDGTLEFDWTDDDGQVQRTVAPFAGHLPLATLRSRAECEGGDFELIDGGRPFDLAEHEDSYRIALPVAGDVVRGQERRWEVVLDAAKSSGHAMRVVIELADGREVRSRDISALIFHPRWFDKSVRPFEPRC